MLTTFDLDEYVFDALRAGASGFLLKDMPPRELSTPSDRRRRRRAARPGDHEAAARPVRRSAPPRCRRRDSARAHAARARGARARGSRPVERRDRRRAVVGSATVKTPRRAVLSKLGLATGCRPVLAFEIELVSRASSARSASSPSDRRVELAEDVTQVRLDGRRGHEQRLRDLAVGPPLRREGRRRGARSGWSASEPWRTSLSAARRWRAARCGRARRAASRTLRARRVHASRATAPGRRPQRPTRRSMAPSSTCVRASSSRLGEASSSVTASRSRRSSPVAQPEPTQREPRARPASPSAWRARPPRVRAPRPLGRAAPRRHGAPDAEAARSARPTSSASSLRLVGPCPAAHARGTEGQQEAHHLVLGQLARELVLAWSSTSASAEPPCSASTRREHRRASRS